MVFYEVLRKGKRYGSARTLIQTDNRERACREYRNAERKLRDGWVILMADGLPEKQATGYWLRSRW